MPDAPPVTMADDPVSSMRRTLARTHCAAEWRDPPSVAGQQPLGNAEEEALTEPDAESDEAIPLVRRLDAFGNHLGVRLLPEDDGTGDHGLARRVGVDAADDRHVQLHDVGTDRHDP